MTLFISIPTRIVFDKTTNLSNYFELNDYGNFEFESIIIFMIKSEIKFCMEFSFGYIFLQIGNFFVNLQIKCHIRCACCPPAGGKF